MVETPKVKRLKLPCPHAGCKYMAMVQVVIDPKNQKAIDKLANEKLKVEVERQHKAGEHEW
jgi:hypothetical protein